MSHKKDEQSKPAKQQTKAQDELISVERLALGNNVSEKVLAGILAHKKWAKGKRVSKNEFKKALNTFLQGGQ